MTNANKFRKRVKNKLIQANPDISDKDLYFSQTAASYALSYKPNHPKKSIGDLTVYQDISTGAVSLHGSEEPLPTIRRFDNLTDFEEQL